MKLLIVEDNPTVRRLIRSVVGSLADEIYECEDGAEAVIAYAAHKPDFVLMDIAMKSVDGITATRQITATDRSARVIIVTSFDQPDLREAAQAAGACGYVLKENLLEVLRLLQPSP
jgi:CheY-like chemotaxis protein